MIQSAANDVIVKIPTKYINNFSSIMKTAAIENNSSVHLEDLVNIKGKVVSLPRVITQDRTHESFTTNDIRVGDTAIFSFLVVYEFYQKEHMGEPLYKNLITYKGEEYWKVDITRVYAVIRDEKIIMVNGYVMAKPFPEDKIVLQAGSKKTRGSKSSELMHIGYPRLGAKCIEAKDGDTIYYNPMKAAKYQINDKPFIILQQHQVLGRQTKSE